MGGEYSVIIYNIFRSRFGLGIDLKKSILGPKTEFSIFWKTLILSFRPKLTFWSTNLKIYPVEYVHMDHTDHLGFQYFCDFDLVFSINISIFLETFCTLEINVFRHFWCL